jgi:hypothetical protein
MQVLLPSSGSINFAHRVYSDDQHLPPNRGIRVKVDEYGFSLVRHGAAYGSGPSGGERDEKMAGQKTVGEEFDGEGEV